jgi:hypothetical protein
MVTVPQGAGRGGVTNLVDDLLSLGQRLKPISELRGTHEWSYARGDLFAHLCVCACVCASVSACGASSLVGQRERWSVVYLDRSIDELRRIAASNDLIDQPESLGFIGLQRTRRLRGANADVSSHSAPHHRSRESRVPASCRPPSSPRPSAGVAGCRPGPESLRAPARAGPAWS